MAATICEGDVVPMRTSSPHIHLPSSQTLAWHLKRFELSAMIWQLMDQGACQRPDSCFGRTPESECPLHMRSRQGRMP